MTLPVFDSVACACLLSLLGYVLDRIAGKSECIGACWRIVVYRAADSAFDWVGSEADKWSLRKVALLWGGPKIDLCYTDAISTITQYLTNKQILGISGIEHF